MNGLKICALLSLLSPALVHGGPAEIERGRYLVKISGCNDCHTRGYGESGGTLAESTWLTGSSTGFMGAWGTTYPSNLRLMVRDLSEAQWLQKTQQRYLPP